MEKEKIDRFKHKTKMDEKVNNVDTLMYKERKRREEKERERKYEKRDFEPYECYCTMLLCMALQSPRPIIQLVFLKNAFCVAQ
jgi:hypothetical protein